MEKGYINVDEREINDITNHLNKNQVNLNDLGNTTQNSFKAMTNTNLFGNGISKITKQVSSVSGSIQRINSSIKKKSQEMLTLDETLASRAETIDVPMDFVTNNSVRSHLFDGITLNKQDGKQVNDDNSINEIKLVFNDETTNTTINDLTTEPSEFDKIKLNEYKDKKNNLGNINNNTQTEIRNLNYSENGIVNQNLRTIENANNQTVQNIEYNQTKNVDVILNNINQTSTLNDLNLENNVQKIEYFYDDFYEQW